MSTAEQIVGEHHFDGASPGLEFCTCGWGGESHAAHVMDALTTASKTIVELPEYDRDFAFSGAEVWPDGYSSVTIRTPIGFVAGRSLNDLAQPEVMRTLALNLLALAAARVAEDGAE